MWNWFTLHPRAEKNFRMFGLEPFGLRLVDPLDYLGFFQLESNAGLVFTDSGGVQEETCVLRVPCVTLRDSTERPETLKVGSNVLAGSDPDVIVEKARFMLGRSGGWKNPFGDGKAGKRIIELLRCEFG